MNKTKERPTSQPITVNIDKLSAMLSCGHATARKIGEQAEAKIIIGRRVLYSVEKVKNYLSYLQSMKSFNLEIMESIVLPHGMMDYGFLMGKKCKKSILNHTHN